MNNADYKNVNFHEYCWRCEHYDKDENQSPCFECLEDPVNSHSKEPINFEERKKRK